MNEIAYPPGTGSEIINLPVYHDWLALHGEQALEPELAIVDAHHHLWERPDSRYMPPDLLADVASGHNVIATVRVENHAMYRSHGPRAFFPVGETEMMASIAEAWSGVPFSTRVAAGIIGYVDLFAGAAAREVLEAHIAAGRGRFRGIRQVTARDEAGALQVPQRGARRGISAGMLKDASFRDGFATLAPLGLTFDGWLYHKQLPELVDLARAFPETSVIVNHVGGPPLGGVR